MNPSMTELNMNEMEQANGGSLLDSLGRIRDTAICVLVQNKVTWKKPIGLTVTGIYAIGKGVVKEITG